MNYEGKNSVREVLTAGTSLEKIVANRAGGDKVFNELISLAKQKHIKVQFADVAVLDKLSKTGKHQGIIAVGAEFEYCDTHDILAHATSLGQDPFILILDGIKDPHNFGSIIRVCDCLGVHGIIIAKDRSCPVNETVVKVSAGASAHVKVAKVTNINREINLLKERGVWVYALELGGSDLAKSDLKGALALVVGSEGEGVSRLTRQLCDGVVTISMVGKVNSLNASVAAGIAIYEAKKQRD